MALSACPNIALAIVKWPVALAALAAQAERARVPVLLVGREEIHDLNARLPAFARS